MTPNSQATHRNRFFIWIALAMLLVIALAFGRSFYLRPMFSDKPLPGYLMLHGITMTAWYLLFLMQAQLIHRGRPDMHRKLGLAALGLAVLVVVTGMVVNLNLLPHMEARGLIETQEMRMMVVRGALGSMISLLVFGALIIAAVLFRRMAPIHKRLMFWAFVWTLGPAFTANRPVGATLDAWVAPWLPFFPADFLWLFALLAYDWVTLRRLHFATWGTFILLAVIFVVITPILAEIPPLQQWLLRQGAH